MGLSLSEMADINRFFPQTNLNIWSLVKKGHGNSGTRNAQNANIQYK